jgi:hypothetical protein
MIKVIPISPIERKHCAYCAQPLVPCLWHNHHEVKTEEELQAFQTNRRVIQVRRYWHERKLHHITIKFFPEKESHWGVDGIFCTNKCAQRFAWAAHHAGWRRRVRVTVET